MNRENIETLKGLSLVLLALIGLFFADDKIIVWISGILFLAGFLFIQEKSEKKMLCSHEHKGGEARKKCEARLLWKRRKAGFKNII